MRTYLATCVLRNGARVVLTVIGSHTVDAINAAIDAFGDRLRTCSAKPSH